MKDKDKSELKDNYEKDQERFRWEPCCTCKHKGRNIDNGGPCRNCKHFYA